MEARKTWVHRVRAWYSPRSIGRSIAIRPRFYFSALAGVGALLFLPRSWSASIREALAWDLSAVIYLALAFRVMLTCRGNVIRARAARQDDSRVVILVIILLAIIMSFAAITGLLAEAKEIPHQSRMLQLGLAAVTIILAWTVTQVVFTLHYAHEFYRPSAGDRAFTEGLNFPGITTRTTGISCTSRHRSARLHRHRMFRSGPSRCAGLSRCTQSSRSSSTPPFWRSPSISRPA